MVPVPWMAAVILSSSEEGALVTRNMYFCRKGSVCPWRALRGRCTVDCAAAEAPEVKLSDSSSAAVCVLSSFAGDNRFKRWN